MEAAGAAATLLTLIGFTLQSLKTVYETTGSIRDGPPMLARLTIAGKELETVLDQLSKLAHDSQPSQQSAEQDVWDALGQSIVRCRADVLLLEKDVAALGVVKSDRLIRKFWKRVRTSLKDKDFERMWSTAQSHVGALKLQLSIIESRRNTAHGKNSVLRYDTVNGSLRNCVSQIQLHSDGIKGHITEHADNLQSSIRDLTTQARHVANGSTQYIDALGAAAQHVGSQLNANTLMSTQASLDIGLSLGSRLEGVSELSKSQHCTIVELLSQIQSTLNERSTQVVLNPNDVTPGSWNPNNRTGQDYTALTTAIDRLGALASKSAWGRDLGAAEVVIKDLELILDFLVNEALERDSSIPNRKRRRIDDNTDLAVATRNFKRMRGLLSASQSVDMAHFGPQNNLNERRCAKVGSHYSRTVLDTQECTAVISCTSRPKKAAPHRQGFSPRNPVDWFEGTVSLRPKSGTSRKKLLLSFLQRFSSSGFTSLSPTLSFHALLPCESAIFFAIEMGDMTSMLGLRNDKEASLTDCDTEGRSLLSYATWYRQLSICQFLIDHGANIDALEPHMDFREDYVCLLEQYGGNDFEGVLEWPDEFNASLAIRQFLLRSGADPMLPSHFERSDGVTQSVLWAVLEHSTDEALAIFLRSGKPYIDPTTIDNRGKFALTVLLDSAVYEWETTLAYRRKKERYIPRVPSKLATLLRHGANPRSQDQDEFSYLHICLGWFHPGEIEADLYREMLECLCVLINNGADVHAVSFDMSVTENAHKFRAGQLWEEALESCGFDVDQVYALDHNRDLEKSSDLYAPTDQRPRVRGPMDIQAYYDKCRKGLKGCATIHRIHKSYSTKSDYVAVRRTWTGKCRWPNGMIHERHYPYDEASDDSSSEQEEKTRACASSDCSEYRSDTADDSDEEMGGVPI